MRQSCQYLGGQLCNTNSRGGIRQRVLRVTKPVVVYGCPTTVEHQKAVPPTNRRRPDVHHAAVESATISKRKQWPATHASIPAPSVTTGDELHVHRLIERMVTMEEGAVSAVHMKRRKPVELNVGRIVLVRLEDQDRAARGSLQRVGPLRRAR